MNRYELRLAILEKKNKIKNLKYRKKREGRSETISNQIKSIKIEIKNMIKTLISIYRKDFIKESQMSHSERLDKYEQTIQEFNKFREKYSDYTRELEDLDDMVKEGMDLRDKGQIEDALYSMQYAIHFTEEIHELKIKGKRTGSQALYYASRKFDPKKDPLTYVYLAVVCVSFFVFNAYFPRNFLIISVILMVPGVVLMTFLGYYRFKRKLEKTGNY